MDSARTPRRVGRLPARPFEIVGTNGVPSNLPQQRPINVPGVDVEDRSAEFLERTNQSVFQGFEYQRQAIASTAQADVAEASVGAGTGFAATFRDIALAVQAGVGAYGDYKQAEAEETARIAELRNEEALRRQQELNARVGAELENDVRNKLVELREAFIQNGNDNSSIVIMREWLNEQRRLAIRQGLSPEVAQEITNIGFSALSETQEKFGSRIIQNQEALRTELVGQTINNLYQEISPDVYRLANNPSATGGFSEVINNVNTKINEFFTGSDFGPLERLQVVNEVYGRLQGSIDEALIQDYRISEQRLLLNDVLVRASNIQQQFMNNPSRMGAEFRMLELELQQGGIDISLSDTFRSETDVIRERLELQQLYNSAAGPQVAPELTIEAQQRVDTINTFTAYEWFRSPFANAYAIEQARNSDDPQARATLSVFEELNAARDEYTELRNEIATYEADMQRVQSDLQEVYDAFEPTGRLGPVVVEDQYLRALIEYAGTERGRMSQETAAALERLGEVEISGLQEGLNNARVREHDLLRSLLEVGVNLQNPEETYNTLQAQSVEALEWLRTNQEQMTNAPPLSSSGVPLAPSSFQQGLPSLPARQSR